MNTAILIGNLTRDPELRTTTSGLSVCTFTVAINRPKMGEKQETDFIPVVAWRATADNCAKYLTKGSKVGVSGRIQTRSYEAQDGSRRYVTEIIAYDVEFLTRKRDGAPPPDDDAAPHRNQPPAPDDRELFGDEAGEFEPLDDEHMPF